MPILRRALLAAFALAAACTANEPATGPGSTSFVTEEPEYNQTGGYTGGAADMGEAASADGGSTGAPMGRTGTVEEGDIYRIDHNRLFYFNTYRGLVIYDLNDAANPKKVSRVPVYGYPVEMYIDNDRVYALLRDSLYLTENTDGQKFEEHRTSQLVTIDISDVAKPVVLKSIDIIGELREGLSRKIDDTIYVTSYIPQYYYDVWWSDWGWYGPIDVNAEQAWVYSFNVADPSNPQLVNKLQVYAGPSGNGPSIGPNGENRWFEGVSISATVNTLEIAENWQIEGASPDAPPGCYDYYAYDRSTVSIIDISDPSGQINLYTKFDSYGQLTDQFKQMYVYDPATQKAYFYGIYANRYWDELGCISNGGTQNSFQTWDVTDGANPKRVGMLRFGEPNEAVAGTIFDTSRNVAFAVTSAQIDPLYAIGYADPQHPTVLSQIDGLSGSMDIFTFVGGSDQYLMGIGTDNTNACTGVGNGNDWQTGVAVSILDVKDVTATRLVQRACVAVNNAEWVSSPANWNLDQGHKMIGLQSDGTTNVVTVPVDYWHEYDDQYWYWYENGSSVGMMSFDLSLDDPTKPPTQQTVLTNHGSFDHAHGSVRRTIIFNHDEAAGPRRMVLNLSDTYLSLFDISDLDHPTKTSELEIAPDVQELYKFGDYVVEHVRDEQNWGNYDLRSEFRVKPMGGALDETPTVATFTVGQVDRVVRWNDALVIFRHQGTWNGPYVPNTQMVIFDLSTPTSPRLRSLTDLGVTATYGYYDWWCGWSGYWDGWWWSSASSWTAIDGGVVFEVTSYDEEGYYVDEKATRKLVYADLSNLDAPQLHTHVLAADAALVEGITPDASDTSGFFVTLKDHVGDKPGQGDYKIALYKYYAQRWSVTDGDIVAGDSTNLPGQLVRTWKSGDRTMLLAQDEVYTWNQNNGDEYGYYHGDQRLHLLERASSSIGTLRDSTVIADRYLEGLTGEGDRLYLTTGYAGWYDDQSKDTTDHLTIFDLSQETLARGFDGSLGVPSFAIMGSQANRLFLRLYDSGVLVLDATDASAPHGDRFLRTLGWGSNLELSGSTLYVAAGQFGVFQRDLGTPSLMP